MTKELEEKSADLTKKKSDLEFEYCEITSAMASKTHATYVLYGEKKEVLSREAEAQRHEVNVG